MTENKRYFKKEYDEEFYILDSEVISEKDFEKKLNYQGYKAFEDSLTSDEIVGLLNENEQLKSENKELRQDNDIKFWKLQCLQSSNNNQVMLFELSRVIQQGYEVSDKFKQYLNEIKEHDKEIREKHKRLFE